MPTFLEAANTVHSQATWKNKKHQKQWITTLKTYVFPLLGDIGVDDYIDTPDILNVLKPIWLSKSETARRVKQRIKTVMDYYKGYRL